MLARKPYGASVALGKPMRAVEYAENRIGTILLGGKAPVSQTIEAVYDGAVLRPETALALEPNTRVRLTLEVLTPTERTPASFLRTARSLNLCGPVDWSANVDNYLYGDGDQPRG
jgi:hypothetical protein